MNNLESTERCPKEGWWQIMKSKKILKNIGMTLVLPVATYLFFFILTRFCKTIFLYWIIIFYFKFYLFRFTNLIGGIANVLVSQYLSYQNSKDAILSELNYIDWELTKEDIMTCDELQRKLLRSSWSLLRRYKLPDNLRLTQDNLDFWHSKVISETDAKIRMRHLINIEQDFQAYPPYWFHRGETALKIDDYAEAKKCFDKSAYFKLHC